MSQSDPKDIRLKPTFIDEDQDMVGATQSTSPVAGMDQEMTGEKLEHYIDDIADTVRVGLDQSISILTPWFFNNMPKIYYQTTPRQEKVRHLSAIITGHVFETKQTVELWDRDRTKVTYIGPGGDRKILLDMSKKLENHKLKMGGVYFSRDRLLFLSTFFCDDYVPVDMDNHRILEKIDLARTMMTAEHPHEKEAIEAYIKDLDNEFIIYATANRLGITYRMVRQMLGQEGTHTFVEPFENSSAARLTLGMKNVHPQEVLEPVLHLINRYDFSVGRAFLVKFEKGYRDTITVMHFIVSHDSSEKITDDFTPIIRLTKALRTLGWVDNDEYSVFYREPYNFSINAVNLIRSMANWCHIFLSKKTPYAYSLYRVRNTFFQHPAITSDVVALFRLKFDPLVKGEERQSIYDHSKAALETRIQSLMEEIDRSIYRECVNFIDHCLKTNYFHTTKTGHAFRMSPKVLHEKTYKDSPYGFFFLTGRNYRAFHVRWKDVARGGMRVVLSRNMADYEYALSGLFDEVYGLSYAQQLKNKDIPEGGSKAVLVLRPGGHRDQAVKACVNALLDLLVEEDESHETKLATQGYYDESELIYLGPDENITNELIEWIPEQARRRKYKYWAAFMSSKPGAGINHKEYGVTSEGVNVFVENTLHYLNINPRETPFTVKLTGGPDGDVAGNELKILHREYGENARVVAIADGQGCAYDPDGLRWSELLRLVEDGLSIIHFDKKHLSSNGFVVTADSDENIRTRNQLHFKVYADIFIPAGGRPYSVSNKNWQMFLNEQNRPTQLAIVEGANIFFTPEARTKLQEHGVLIVKDSSANKTGVICSSYEIIASLTTDQKEYAEIKETYVKEVIDILRSKADSEAKLLFRELSKSNGQKSLVDLSLEISKEINDLTDLLLDQLEADAQNTLEDDLFKEIVLRHCPKILVQKYRERISERLPVPHQIAIVASYIASYIIYREGLGWLRSVPHQHLPMAMRVYMEKDRLAFELRSHLEQSDIDGKALLQAILARSAARDLTIMELQDKSILA